MNNNNEYDELGLYGVSTEVRSLEVQGDEDGELSVYEVLCSIYGLDDKNIFQPF